MSLCRSDSHRDDMSPILEKQGQAGEHVKKMVLIHVNHLIRILVLHSGSFQNMQMGEP